MRGKENKMINKKLELELEELYTKKIKLVDEINEEIKIKSK